MYTLSCQGLVEWLQHESFRYSCRIDGEVGGKGTGKVQGPCVLNRGLRRLVTTSRDDSSSEFQPHSHLFLASRQLNLSLAVVRTFDQLQRFLALCRLFSRILSLLAMLCFKSYSIVLQPNIAFLEIYATTRHCG
jgi:hypothetical protein